MSRDFFFPFSNQPPFTPLFLLLVLFGKTPNLDKSVKLVAWEVH